MDYESTDGGGSGQSQYKDCPDCEGEGSFPDSEFKEHRYPCDTCKCTGQIEMTSDEIEMEKDARRDDEADKQRD